MIERIEIDYMDLAEIIEGIHFEVDIDEIEDFIDFLRNNKDCTAILETFSIKNWDDGVYKFIKRSDKK